MYEYKHQASYRPPPDHHQWITGNHGDDMFLPFGEVQLESLLGIQDGFNEEEEKLSLDIIHYYSNFAYSG